MKLFMFLFTVAALAGGDTIPPDMAKGVEVLFPACRTEDSDWCYWNAEKQGNGQGESFISIYGRQINFG